MSTEDIFAIARCVERILIVIICGASLGFGWNLFRLGIVNDQQAELTWKDWKFALKQVGPGVFFALFAVVGLIAAIRSPLRIDVRSQANVGGQTASAPKNSSAEVSVVNYEHGGNEDNVRAEVKALNTVFSLWEADAPSNLSKVDKDAWTSAVTILARRRELLLVGTYSEKYDRYKALREQVATDPRVLDALSPQQKTDYFLIDGVTTANFMTSRNSR